MNYKTFFLFLLGMVLVIGCYGRMPGTDVENNKIYSTYNVQRTPADELTREGTVIFVRPKDDYSLFGTESVRDYIEIVYEQAYRNEAGYLGVKLGIRNIGGMHYYDQESPNFPLSIKTACYDRPFNSAARPAPVYETNWKTIKMIKGVITEYESVCLKKSASYYQIVISEILKN